MKIAVNTRLLLKGKLEGIGRFSCETLKRITQKHSEHQFFFIFDRQYDESFIFSKNVYPIIVRPQTRHPFLWYYWFEYQIPKILKKLNADVFLSPDGYLSLKTNVPQISVIHDINFVHNPKQLPFLISKYYNHFFPKYAQKASHLVTVSEYSKQDISKSFNIDANKITVCYNAANANYIPINEEEKILIKAKYTNSEDYFIFVGALNPRKNITGLLKSFDIFKNLGNNPQKLVIVGSAMHLIKEIDATLKTLEHRSDIIFTGRLDSEDLSKIMGAALGLVYIPHFEGFGIPLVEAMHSEIPIISGNTTSLPEVVGDAALMVSPTDYAFVANNMELLAKNKDIRKTLIDKGKAQREKFSWDNSADILWKCIENTFIC